MRARAGWAALAALCAAACAGGAGEARPTAIVGATVAAGESLLPDAVVVIEAGHVAAFGTRAETAIPKRAALLDGRGWWIVPADGAPPVVGTHASITVFDGDPTAPGTRVLHRWVAGQEQP